MTLTTEYQYIGKSNFIYDQRYWAGYGYCLLLYAKTSADLNTGRHTVTAKLRLVSSTTNRFYGCQTSGDISIAGNSVDSWSWQAVPAVQWNDSELTEEGATYPCWIDIRESSLAIDVGYGAEENINLGGSWTFKEGTAGFLPQVNVTAIVSATVTLPMIAGASQPSVSADAIDMGSRLVINTNRIPGSGLTHTLAFSFGNTSGVIAQDVGDSAEWYPSIELARQIPDAVSGTAVINCTTYAGGTPIGTRQIPVELLVPEGIVPSVSVTWEDISGAFEKVGICVKGISALRVDVTGEGAYGSRPTSSAVSLDGKSYGGGTITVDGALNLIAYVTDSRSRTGIKECTVNVADYAPPSLTVSASRCTDDGTADDAGDYAKITVTGYVTQVNESNSANLMVSWGAEPEESTPSVGNISWQKIVPADVNATMTITAELSDELITVPRTIVLSTGYATLDLLYGGKGISFGKAATREGFDCAMPAYFSGGIYGIASDGTVDSKSLFERVAAIERAIVNL